jgi:hypothetical protein
MANSASAVAYRAQQLAHAYAVLYRVSYSAPEWAKQTIRNALIESALSNARGVAYFFTRTSDVHVSMFVADWSDPVIKIAQGVESPISRHLSHATKGASDGEKHPGAWPIAELAVVLVGGLVRLVDALPDDLPVLFVPSPADTLAFLDATEPLRRLTPVSDNPSVGDLTKLLQGFIAESGAT